MVEIQTYILLINEMELSTPTITVSSELLASVFLCFNHHKQSSLAEQDDYLLVNNSIQQKGAEIDTV